MGWESRGSIRGPAGEDGSGGGGGTGGHLQFPTPQVGEWVMMGTASTSTLQRPVGELQCGYMFLPAGTYTSAAWNADQPAGAGTTVRLVAYLDVNGKPGTTLADVGSIDPGWGVATTTGFSFTIPTEGAGIWTGLVAQGTGSAPSIWGSIRTGDTTVFVNTSYPALFYANVNPTWMATGVSGAAPAGSALTNRDAGCARLAFQRTA